MAFPSAGNNGNVMVEYGLIGVLLVLITVPALGLLGDGLKVFYGNGGNLSNAQSLFNLLSSGGGAPGTATSPAFSATLSQGLSDMETNGGRMSMRMKDGVLEIGLPNGASVAINDTGAEGGAMSVAATAMLADQFARLADEFDGEVGDDLVALARELSSKGHALADAEEGFNHAPAWEQEGLDSAYCQANACATGEGSWETPARENVFASHWDYANTHQQLITLIKNQPGFDPDSGQFTDPALKAFHDSLNFYGEGIDTVADKHYLTRFGRDPAQVNSGLDVDVSEVTIDIAPVFTEKTSDRIAVARQASQQAGP